MKRLIVVGAGGFGREVLAWASDIEKNGPGWRIGGVLDAKTNPLEGLQWDVPLLGDPATYEPHPDDLLVCAIGDPPRRLKIARLLAGRGGVFTTIVHPSAIVGPYCRIGAGSVLCPGSVVTTNVTLGQHVILNVGSCVGHDAVLGDGCTLNPHSDVGGFARLAEGVFLGTHADILPKAVVGEYARVGAGSVVLRRVEPYVTVLGVPAKPVYVVRRDPGATADGKKANEAGSN